MILVVGATGLVGSEICVRLAAQGEKVRALVRSTSSPEKIEHLRSLGIELLQGDLKDISSLAVACRGVEAVISTASSTFSRAAGDSIESVDAAGQINLANAAKAAHIERFLFVSFRRPPAISFPLGNAKAAVEDAIATMNFTVVQASYFMEAWLSPALGFDYVHATALVRGSGTSSVSWVSFRDVAHMCVLALRHRAAERKTLAFGGPEELSLLEVVSRFERRSGRQFKLEYIPEQVLRTQFDSATDSLQKSFAALMLGSVYGDAINMTSLIEEFGLKLASVDDYARNVLGPITAA